MSLLGKVFKGVKGALTGFVTGGPLGAVAGAVAGVAAGKTNLTKSAGLPAVINSPILQALPTSGSFSASALVKSGSAAVSMLPSLAKTMLPKVASKLPVIGGAVTVGTLLYDAYGNIVGHGSKKRRRMNPMNARAARRAIRRIKGARKMLQQIERQLPKQRVSPAARARAPRGNVEFIRQG